MRYETKHIYFKRFVENNIILSITMQIVFMKSVKQFQA